MCQHTNLLPLFIIKTVRLKCTRGYPYKYTKAELQSGVNMGLLSKIKYKTTDRIADKVSDGIVNKMFGKKKEQEYEEQPQAPAAAEPVPETEAPRMTEAEAQAIAQQQMAAQQAAAASINSEQMTAAMGIAYNTKRCPECQAVCFNAPVECPYCHADLKGVKPLTPEELEALE